MPTSAKTTYRTIRRRVARWAFDQRPLAWKPRLVAIGDSHASCVGLAAFRPGLRASVDVCAVKGATALGTANPNSRSDARRIFRQRCNEAHTWQTLVFLLGEVDCGFLIWYLAEKRQASVEALAKRSLDAYQELISEQVAHGFRTLVLSVPPPTIPDNQSWGDVANARREVKATQRERTDLTLSYNTDLRQVCVDTGAEFVDVTMPTLNGDTDLVRDEYLNPNPLDHHLHYRRYAELIGRTITATLQGRSAGPAPGQRQPVASSRPP